MRCSSSLAVLLSALTGLVILSSESVFAQHPLGMSQRLILQASQPQPPPSLYPPTQTHPVSLIQQAEQAPLPQPSAQPSPSDMQRPLGQIKPLSAIRVDIRQPHERQLPTDYSQQLFAGAPQLGTNPRPWMHRHKTWEAPEYWRRPLYFEDVLLERYGQMRHPWIQPAVSGAHFFGTLPALPYKMGLDKPVDCVSSLGYYRPGSCAPLMRNRLPWEADATLYEASALLGYVFLLP